jgi:predicted PurR-regulated permease PerM
VGRSIAESLTSQFLGRVVLLVGVVASFWLCWQIADILLLAFAGVLLAIFFQILVKLLQHFVPLTNQWALLVIVAVLLGLLGLLGWFTAPQLLADLNALSDQVPTALRQISEQVDRYGWVQRLLNRLPSLEQVVTPNGGLFAQITGTFSTVLSLLANLLLILFVGLFLAANPALYRAGVLQLAPAPRRPRLAEVINKVVTTLRWWILGQLFAMIVIGVLTGVGLWFIGMPFALALGVITGLLEFIPYIGPIVAGSLALLLAFTQSPIQALYVLVLYIGIQQIEGNLLTPLVHRYTVALPPALTLVAVVVIGTLFGFVGLLVATPLLAVMMVLIKMLYIEDVLGGTPDLPHRLFE